MTTTWTPWGQQPANDNARPLMIGLTGKRNVGKSTVAEYLEEHHGFERIHAFEAGKAAAQTWFESFGLDGYAMVYGPLKDVPCGQLPGGVAPRYFLERFGEFMGAQLGVEWTLALEIAAARRRAPRAPIVVESVVYEAEWFRAQGGLVVRLVRPGHEGPAGVESDAMQAAIAEDAVISASTVDALLRQARGIVDGSLFAGRAA